MQTAALLFGPGLPLTGQTGVVQLSQDQTRIEACPASPAGADPQPVAQAALAQLTLRQIGFGKPGLELAWEDDGGQRWLAHVLEAKDAQAWLRHPALAALPATAGNFVYAREEGADLVVLASGTALSLTSAGGLVRNVTDRFGEADLYIRLNVARAVRQGEHQDIVEQAKPPATFDEIG